MNITYSIREDQESCKQETIRREITCGHEIGAQLGCDCQIMNTPSIITYDGAIIDFHGNCSYVLTKFEDKDCKFAVLANNNGADTLLKSIEIIFEDNIFTLDKHKVFRINHQVKNLPYRLEDAEVFISSGMVRFYSSKCELDVSFDGDSRGEIKLAKEKYASKIEGLCGNCNGIIKDDFRGRNNQDLSENPKRIELLVNEWTSIEHQCENPFLSNMEACPATTQKAFLENDDFCGIFSQTNGKFAEIMKNFDMLAYSETCIRQLCPVRDDYPTMHTFRCNIIEGIVEAAYEKKLTINFDWRAETKCPVICARNQEYSTNGSACPKTCEENFFGTDIKKTCPLNDNVPSCRCKEGYVLDGTVCVRPEQCQCLERCEDNSGTEKCNLWKREGKCESFPVVMNNECKLTCGFCVRRVSDCKDKISSETCEKIKAENQCSDNFYTEMCGFTCHENKCPCAPKRVIKEECDAKKLMKVTTIIYRKENGLCKPEKTVEMVECGICETTKKVTEGECNVCTGSQINHISYYERDNSTRECKHIERDVTMTCKKCEPSSEKNENCDLDYKIITTVLTTKPSEDCKQCKQLKEEFQSQVSCAAKVEQSKCNENCLFDIITTDYKPVDCKCESQPPVTRTEECCCKPKNNTITCKGNTELIETRFTSDLVNGKCIYTPLVVSSQQIGAPPKMEEPGPCINGYKDVKVTTYSIEDCNVKETITTRKDECPLDCGPSRNETVCNKETNAFETYELYKKEISRKCVDQKDLVYSQFVECKENATETPAHCDTDKCEQVVVVNKNVLNDCKCSPTSSSYLRTCCCKNPDPIKSCKDTHFEIKHTTLELVDYKCEVKSETVLKENVNCTETTAVEHECILGNQLVDTISYEVENCECTKKVTTSSKPCQVKCPEASTEVSECDQESCYKVESRTYYIVENHVCVKWVEIKNLQCCVKPPKVEKTCDTEIGAFKIVTTNYHPTTVNTTYEHVNCSHVDYVVEAPNLTQEHFQKTTKNYFILNKNNCSCEPKQEITFKRISCPELFQPQPNCENDQIIVTKNLTSTVNPDTNGCDQSEKITKEEVMCAPLADDQRNKTCVDCKIHLEYFKSQVENCKCITKTVKEETNQNCCCPKPTETETCSNDTIVKISVNYTQDKDFNCTAEMKKSLNKIECELPLGKISEEILVKNCTKYTRVRQVSIEDCKCIVSPWEIFQTKVCCPEQSLNVTCSDTFKIETYTNYTLTDGECIMYQKEVKIDLNCPESKTEEGVCHRETFKKMVTDYSYSVDKNTCECKENKQVRTETCGANCEPDRVVREPLTNTTDTIYKIVSDTKLVNNSYICTYNKTFVGVDEKVCPEPITRKRCKNDTKIADEVYTTKSYKLITLTNLGVEYKNCVEETSNEAISYDLVCSKLETSWSTCQNFTKEMEYHLPAENQCKCKKEILKKACDCHLKNKTFRECKDGKYQNIALTYEENNDTCEEKKSSNEDQVQCPARSVEESKCDIVNGIYRMKKVTTIQYSVSNDTCKCIKEETVEYKICGCKDNETEDICHHGIQLANVISYNYTEDHQCKVLVHKSILDKNCEEPKVISLGCDQDTCLEKFVLNYAIKDSSCQCKPIRVERSRACCCKPDSEAAKRAGDVAATKKFCFDGKEVEEEVKYELKELDTPMFPKFADNHKQKYCVIIRTKVENDFYCDPEEKISFNCDEASESSAKIIKWNMPACCRCVCKETIQPLGGCNCKKSERHFTKCINGKFEEINIDYIFKGKECVPIESKTTKFCSCPEAETKTVCENGILKSVETSYKLAFNQCIKITKIKSIEIEFETINKELHEKISEGQCDPNTNEKEVVIMKTIYDKGTCSFNNFKSTMKLRCACPDCKEISRSCSKDHNQFVKILECYQLHQGQCMKYTKEEIESINCNPEEKMEIGECSKGVSIVKTIKNTVSDCECKINSKPIIMKCKCHQDGIADLNQCVVKDEESLEIFETTLKKCNLTYENANCEFHHDRKIFGCNNAHHTFVHQISQTVLSPDDCKCHKKEESLTCDCSCVKEKKFRTCNPFSREIVTTTISGKWVNNCKCETNHVTQKEEIHCPVEPIIVKGKCENGLSHITEKIHTMDYGSCECKIKEKIYEEECDPVNEGAIEKRECLPTGDILVINKEKTIEINGVNITKLLSTKQEKIVCLNPEFELKCQPGQITGKLIKKSHQVDNCHCVVKEDAQDISCDCLLTPVLVAKGECSDDCFVENTYKIGKMSKVNGTCQNELISKRELCCCSKERKTTQRCTNGGFKIIEVTFESLGENGICQKQKIIQKVKNDCEEKDVEETGECDEATGEIEIKKFRFIPDSDCTCKKTLTETKIAKCKCPKPTVENQCDPVEKSLSIKQISFELKDQHCIEKVEVEKRPFPDCGGITVDKHNCDMNTGIQNITVTVSFLNAECRCEKLIKKKSQICACPSKPKVEKKCLPNNQFLVSEITETLVDNACQKSERIDLQDIKCSPSDWTPEPNQPKKCGENVIFFRNVPKNCTCVKETKTMDCPCDCKKSDEETCEDDLFKIISYHGQVSNCICKYTESYTKKLVECPKPEVIRGECNQMTCQLPITTYEYKNENCKCIKVPSVTQEKCCCAPPVETKSCNKAYNEIIETKKSQLFIDGRCFNEEITKYKPTVCPKMDVSTDCAPITQCVLGKRTLECTYYEAKNCKCVKKTGQIVKDCSCKDDEVIRGECDRTTCKRLVTITKYSGGSCDAKVEKNYETCCCKNEKTENTVCSDDSQEITTITNKELFEGDCYDTKTVINKDVVCETKIETESCNKNCKAVVRETYYEPRQCKCVVQRKAMQAAMCCCPQKNINKVSCVADDIREILLVDYKLTADNKACHKTKRVIRQKLTCKEPMVVPGACDLTTCIQPIYKLFWTPEKCTCKGGALRKFKKCCELHKDFETEKCDEEEGVLITTSYTFEINEETGETKNEKKITKKKLSCPKPERVESDCEKNEHGYFEKKITVKEWTRVGCECISSEKVTPKICSCKKDSEKKVCVSDNEEQSILVQYILENDVCMPKETKKDTIKVKCPQTKIENNDCNKNGYRVVKKTEYESRNCKCYPKVYTENVKCSCPKPTKVTICTLTGLVEKTTSYELVCKSENDCQCVMNVNEITTHSSKDLDTELKFGKCIDGKRNVSKSSYETEDCDCKLKHQTFQIDCKECIDVLDQSECSKMVTNGGCFAVSTSRNCQKTCGYCYKWEKNHKRFAKITETVVPGADLNVPGKESPDVVVSKTPLHSVKDCLDKCNSHEYCTSLAADFLMKECRLYRPNRDTVLRSGEENPLFYNKDIYYVELRPIHDCQHVNIEKVGKCECDANNLCLQELEIVKMMPSTLGTCRSKTFRVKAVCPSVDEKDPKECARLAKEGQCSDPKVAKECAFHCDDKLVRVCYGRKTQESCHLNTNTIKVHEVTLATDYGFCKYAERERVTDIECTKENLIHNPEVEVGLCVNGTRTIRSITYEDGTPKSEETTSNCEKCCPSVSYTLSDCKDDSRTLIMTYYENKNGCCVLKSLSTKFVCNNNCPADATINGVCIYGEKLVTTLFYTDKTCLTRKFHNTIKCGLP